MRMPTYLRARVNVTMMLLKSKLNQKLIICSIPKMCAILQLVSAPLNPIPIADHFRRSHPLCEQSYWSADQTPAQPRKTEMKPLSTAHTRGNGWAKSLAKSLAQLFPSFARKFWWGFCLARPWDKYLSCLITLASPKFTRTREETAELTASRVFLLSCFLSCAPGFQWKFATNG